MARGVVINTVGRDLEKYRKDIVKRVRNLTVDIGTELEIAAYRDLRTGSKDRINMKRAGVKNLNFIDIEKKVSMAGLKVEVGVMGENELAAYFEFGTGLSAVQVLAPYPQFIKDIAFEFYKNGQGTIEGHPFLFNNAIRLWAVYQSELKKMLDEEYRS